LGVKKLTEPYNQYLEVLDKNFLEFCPFKVILSDNLVPYNHEYMTWIVNNIKGRFLEHPIQHQLYFEDVDDAIAFKLRWL